MKVFYPLRNERGQMGFLGPFLQSFAAGTERAFDKRQRQAERGLRERLINAQIEKIQREQEQQRRLEEHGERIASRLEQPSLVKPTMMTPFGADVEAREEALQAPDLTFDVASQPASMEDQIKAFLIRSGKFTPDLLKPAKRSVQAVTPGATLFDLEANEPLFTAPKAGTDIAAQMEQLRELGVLPPLGAGAESLQPEISLGGTGGPNIRLRSKQERAPTLAELATRAAQGDTEARKALSLIKPQAPRAETRTELARAAARGDKNAQEALKLLSSSDPIQQLIGQLLAGQLGSGGAPASPAPAPAPAPAQRPPSPVPGGVGGAFDRLPPASQFPGKTIKDTETGGRFKSDGQKWIPVR